MKRKHSLFLKSALVALALGVSVPYVPVDQAEARAGRGRSVGRNSQPPAASPWQRSGNSYDHSNNGQRSAPYGNTVPGQQGQVANRGGLLRGLGAGIAGGLLGGMLMRTLGFGGYGGGGFGILPILILAGLAYLVFRSLKQRRNATAGGYAGIGGGDDFQIRPSYGGRVENTPPREPGMAGSVIDVEPASFVPQIPTETAQDVFFRVQAAWSRRDLEPVRGILDDEMRRELQADVDELKHKGQINRLENVAVRSTEALRTWQEDDSGYAAVRIAANIVDYTVDEKSGAVVAGDAVNPTKFDEIWVFRQSPVTRTWSLAGIKQV